MARESSVKKRGSFAHTAPHTAPPHENQQFPEVSKRVKRDLSHRQKRPTTQAKDTYYHWHTWDLRRFVTRKQRSATGSIARPSRANAARHPATPICVMFIYIYIYNIAAVLIYIYIVCVCVCVCVFVCLYIIYTYICLYIYVNELFCYTCKPDLHWVQCRAHEASVPVA
jgi:hypothetical protein